MFSPWCMGRSEKFWDDAMTFDPQRFIDDPKPSPFKFTAFQVNHTSHPAALQLYFPPSLTKALAIHQLLCFGVYNCYMALVVCQAGPRVCLGQNLAMLEMKYTISRLLLQFRLKLEQDPASVTYMSTLTLPVKGKCYVSY